MLCVLILCVLAYPAQGAAAAAFPDVDLQTEVGAAAQKMAEAGVISGYPDGRFHAEAWLTRGEFVKIVNLTFGLRLSDDTLGAFGDVPSSHWAYGQIQIARKAGYIQGVGENLFQPAGGVTRQEVCVMVGRLQSFENLTGYPVGITDAVADWAKPSVENAIACGLFQLPADGRFRGTEVITRGEACVALVPYVTSNSGPDDSKLPPAEEQEEAQVAGYIQKMVDKFAKIKPKLSDYTNSKTVKDNMELLIGCMERALDARENGTALTRAYLDKTFAVEIKTFRAVYQKLSKQELADLKSIVADLAYLDEIEAVMGYFGVSFG